MLIRSYNLVHLFKMLTPFANTEKSSNFSIVEVAKALSRELMQGNHQHFQIFYDLIRSSQIEETSVQPQFQTAIFSKELSILIDDLKKEATEIISHHNQELRGYNLIKTANAYSFLGMMYGDSVFGEKNAERALEYHQKAHDLGQQTSTLYLSVAYFLGRGCQKDVYKAIKLLTNAIDSGNEEARKLLTAFYLDPNSDCYDEKKAGAQLKKLDKLGGKKLLNELFATETLPWYGEFYQSFLKQQGKKGFDYESIIASSWEPKAYSNLARHYIDGDFGKQKDVAKAVMLLECAIATHFGLSTFNESCLKQICAVGLSSQQAVDLLNLAWVDLLHGMHFTPHTMNIFKTQCHAEILKRLTDECASNYENVSTNLTILNQIIKNENHPLAIILKDGDGHAYAKLEAHVKKISEQRTAFMLAGRSKASFFHKLPPELTLEVLAWTHGNNVREHHIQYSLSHNLSF